MELAALFPHVVYWLTQFTYLQNNPYMLPKMVDLVVNAATAPSPINGALMTHLIDCYCGSGLFALGSSSYFDVCVGIEVNAMAVEEAKANAELNGIRNCDFVSASAEAIFQSKDAVRVEVKDGGEEVGTVGEDEALLVKDFPRDNTVVVVDPPRKGENHDVFRSTKSMLHYFIQTIQIKLLNRLFRRVPGTTGSVPSSTSCIHELRSCHTG
jgi:tRNA/tmRNA/rRNA uracil-C5-methylase (TrmA/RlmC/RlmD family)